MNAFVEPFARALAAATGLTHQACLAWSTAEVGANNNLGIMDTPGVPRHFPTPKAGATAAAALIASAPLYAGIRASVGGTSQAQMDAIAHSPWHLGPAGLAAAGGIDPYYVGVFGAFGYVAGGGTQPPEVDVEVIVNHWPATRQGTVSGPARRFDDQSPFAELSSPLAPGPVTVDADVRITQTGVPHGLFYRVVTGPAGRCLVASSAIVALGPPIDPLANARKWAAAMPPELRGA